MSKVRQSSRARLTSINGSHSSALSAKQLVTKDPVFRLFHGKLSATWTVIINVLFAGLVFLADILGKPPNERPLEAFTSLRKILIIAFGLSVYFLQPGWIADLFNGLEKNRVIVRSRSGDYDYDDFQSDRIRRVDSRLCTVLGFLFLVAFWIRRLLTYSHKRSLWLELAALFIVYALPYYAFVVTLTKFCLALFSTKRLFDLFEVRVNPLHIDGVGGFRPIGRILLKYAIVLAVFVSLATAGRILSSIDDFRLILGRSEVLMALLATACFPLF
ncbi:MAG: hypothetical protein WAM70_02280, partial [Pyrinomonadaceae bacterium]